MSEARSNQTVDPILEIKNLQTHFMLDTGTIRAVDGVNLSIGRGKTLGVIGESGCGKSVTAHSILRLTPSPPGKIVGGEILLHRYGEIVDLVKLSQKGEQLRNIRGNDIGMIFQEPMTSFGPLHTIGHQIIETILVHQKATSEQEARIQAIELLRQVGIPNPEQRVDAYPHEFSGGMRQRAMIAMAISCSPMLLIADEPTTSLDVTVEAQIIELLSELQTQTGMAIMLISHNLALVSEMADDIAVMYLGKRVHQAAPMLSLKIRSTPTPRGCGARSPVWMGGWRNWNRFRGTCPARAICPQAVCFRLAVHTSCRAFATLPTMCLILSRSQGIL